MNRNSYNLGAFYYNAFSDGTQNFPLPPISSFVDAGDPNIIHNSIFIENP